MHPHYGPECCQQRRKWSNYSSPYLKFSHSFMAACIFAIGSCERSPEHKSLRWMDEGQHTKCPGHSRIWKLTIYFWSQISKKASCDKIISFHIIVKHRVGRIWSIRRDVYMRIINEISEYSLSTKFYFSNNLITRVRQFEINFIYNMAILYYFLIIQTFPDDSTCCIINISTWYHLLWVR
jgi:hypothetical protein